MRLSIITVTKNDLPGLERTFRSLIFQDNLAFEWIVIDGSHGSDSVDFLRKLEPKFDITIESHEPQGIYVAMNQGVSISNGDWLLFLNAGDILLKSDAISVFERQTSKFADAECLAFGVGHFSKSGYLYELSIPMASESYWQIHHQGALISKRSFHAVGGYDTSLKWAADGKLLDLLVTRGSVKIFKSTLVGFEIGGASAQNYVHVLEEISSYRELNTSRLDTLCYVGKNHLKLLLIKIEKSRLGFVVRPYFRYREQIIASRYPLDWLQGTRKN